MELDHENPNAQILDFVRVVKLILLSLLGEKIHLDFILD